MGTGFIRGYGAAIGRTVIAIASLVTLPSELVAKNGNSRSARTRCGGRGARRCDRATDQEVRHEVDERPGHRD